MQIHVQEKTSSITKRLKEKRESANRSFVVDDKYNTLFTERMHLYMGQPFPATLFEACQWGLNNIKETDEDFDSSYYSGHKFSEIIFRYINAKYKELGGNFSIVSCTKRTIDVLDKHFKCLIVKNPVHTDIDRDTIVEIEVFDEEKVEAIFTAKGELWVFVPVAYIHGKLCEDVKTSLRDVIDGSKVVASAAHHIGSAVKNLGSLLGSIETYDDDIKKFKSCGELFDKDHRPSTKPIDLMLAGRTKRKPWER